MLVLKNRMPMWHMCLRNVYFQSKHSKNRSLLSSSVPPFGSLLQQKSNIGQVISLCSLSSKNCLRPQFNRLFRQCPAITGRPFSLSSHQTMASNSLFKRADNQQLEQLLSDMNIRLVNENNFLSWCRNTYLSSVVGVAMITEGTTLLSQNAGIGALVVGTMNLFWGTTCHITNLIKLRNVSGMSGLTLFLNITGSLLHCLLWTFVLICYIGFLDETNAFESHRKTEVDTERIPNLELQHNTARRKGNEV